VVGNFAAALVSRPAWKAHPLAYSSSRTASSCSSDAANNRDRASGRCCTTTSSPTARCSVRRVRGRRRTRAPSYGRTTVTALETFRLSAWERPRGVPRRPHVDLHARLRRFPLSHGGFVGQSTSSRRRLTAPAWIWLHDRRPPRKAVRSTNYLCSCARMYVRSPSEPPARPRRSQHPPRALLLQRVVPRGRLYRRFVLRRFSLSSSLAQHAASSL